MCKTISEKMPIEDFVRLGDKIHNATEIVCLTHSLDKEGEHDLLFAMIGENNLLVHLIAKQCCENPDFFKVLCLAFNKLDYVITNKNK